MRNYTKFARVRPLLRAGTRGRMCMRLQAAYSIAISWARPVAKATETAIPKMKPAGQFPHGNRAHLADMICAVRKSNIRIEHQKDLLFLSIQEQKLISTEAAHACFAALSFCWQR